MPEKDVLPSAYKSARGASCFLPEDDLPTSCFMPEEASKYITRWLSNRCFLTSDGPGSAYRLTSRDPSVSSNLKATAESGFGNNDKSECDEHGNRWGLSGGEIVRRGAMVGACSSDDEDDFIEGEVVEHPEELLPEDSNINEVGFERDLFENDNDYLQRSSPHSKESMGEVEEEDEKEAKEKDFSSHLDDAFEKMMTPTAAASAAADDLIGT